MLVFHFASLICPSQQLLQLVLANSQLVKALLNCFNLFHADYIASCYKAYGPTQLGTRCIRNNPHIVGREKNKTNTVRRQRRHLRVDLLRVCSD